MIQRKKFGITRIFGALVLVAIAIVSVCWFVFSTDGTASNETGPRKSSLIKEAAPVVVPKTELPPQVDDDPNGMPTEVGQRKNGYIKLPSGRIHKIRGEYTNRTDEVRPSFAIFPHMSENVVASLLTLEPGQVIVGTPRYNGAFTQDFIESLKEPIIVLQSDPPDVQELKRAMNEAKIELKAAYDRGEDIEKIMLDSRAELQRLAKYKQDLLVEVDQYAEREDVTADDVEDYIGAANKMLESRGIAPIKNTPFTRIKLKMKEKWEKEK